jgi:DNA-binding transcriptional LysR family regulator
MVESARADFGLASLMTVPPGLRYEPLFDTRLKLIGPPGNPFGLDDPPTLRQIATAPFIAFPPTSTINQFLDAVFGQKNMRLHTVQVLNNFEMVKKYVQLGLGVAILDDYAVAGDEDRLMVVDLGPDFPPRNYGLIFRKRKYQPPQVAAFLASMLE